MNNTLPLETRSLILRQFSPSDTPKVFAMSLESGMRQWIPDQVYDSEETASEVLDYLIGQYSSPDVPAQAPYVLGVCLKDSGELIGHVGLSPAEGQIEIGYATELKYQGKGYATEAVAAMSDLGLAAFNLPSILGIVASENAGSCKVLERAGFELAGESLRPMHGETRLVKTYQKLNKTVVR